MVGFGGFPPLRQEEIARMGHGEVWIDESVKGNHRLGWLFSQG